MKVRRQRRSTSTRLARDEARRFATNVSTGLLIVGAVAALVTVANRWAQREDLRSIRIIGRHVLDSSEIVPEGMIPDSIPLRSLDLVAIERSVASHPFIAEASVYRGENGALVIEVSERTPVAATLIDDNVFYIDSLGAVLPGRFGSVVPDPLLIGGIGARTDGQRFVVDSARAAEALTVMKRIREYSDLLYQQVSELRRLPRGDYQLVMADGGVPVLIGYPDDIVSRLGKLDRFLTTVAAESGAGRLEMIDLRWKGEVVVRWRGEEG